MPHKAAANEHNGARMYKGNFREQCWCGIKSALWEIVAVIITAMLLLGALSKLGYS
jgi:hypothetical protein